MQHLIVGAEVGSPSGHAAVEVARPHILPLLRDRVHFRNFCVRPFPGDRREKLQLGEPPDVHEPVQPPICVRADRF